MQCSQSLVPSHLIERLNNRSGIAECSGGVPRGVTCAAHSAEGGGHSGACTHLQGGHHRAQRERHPRQRPKPVRRMAPRVRARVPPGERHPRGARDGLHALPQRQDQLGCVQAAPARLELLCLMKVRGLRASVYGLYVPVYSATTAASADQPEGKKGAHADKCRSVQRA